MADRQHDGAEAFAETLWQRVEAEVGPVDAVGRAAWEDRIARLRGRGVPAEEVADDLAALIGGSARAFKEGLEAFNALVQAIDVCASVVEESFDRLDVVDFVADARVRVAALYRGLAELAPYAGVPDMPRPQELTPMVEEAVEARRQWQEARASKRG